MTVEGVDTLPPTLPHSAPILISVQPTPMTEFFADYLSDLSALSDGDLSCLLCDATDFEDDDAFQIIVAEMRARSL